MTLSSEPNRPNGYIDLNQVQARINAERNGFRSGIDVSDGSIERGLNEINKGFDMLSSLGKGLKDKVLCSNLDKHKNHPKCNQIKEYYKKNLGMKSGDLFYTEGKARDSAEKSANKPLHEKMFAVLSKLNGAPGAAQQLHSASHYSFYLNATTPKQKLTAVTSWASYISNTTRGAKAIGEKGKALASAGEAVLKDLKAAQVPAKSKIKLAQASNDNVTSDASKKAESATEAAEIAKEKLDVYAVLAKVIKIESQKPADIKARLVEIFSEVDNAGQLLDSLMSRLEGVQGVPGLTDGTARALINRTGLKGVVATLKSQFGNEKLTPDQAKKAADMLMEGAGNLQKSQESSKPFELTPLSGDQLASRASDLFGLEGVAENEDTKLEASKVKTHLSTLLDKAIAGKNLEGLKAIGKVLGFVVNETDIDKAIGYIKENQSEINSRIDKLSKAVDGKSQNDVQALAAEANKKNADQLLNDAAKDFPEHVGTPRWKNWVKKLANGETQKPFGEYLAEDEPIKGLEGLFLMLKKFFMQFGDLFSGINPKDGEKTLSEKLQGEVDSAKDLINQTYLEKAGEKLGLSAEEVTENSKGIDFYNQNKDLLEKFPNMNIKDLDEDANGKVSPAEKIKFLQDNPEKGETLKAVLQVAKSKDYVKQALDKGLALGTLGALAKFEEELPEDRKAKVKVSVDEKGNLVIAEEGGETTSVPLSADKEGDIISALRFYLEGGGKDPEKVEAPIFIERTKILAGLTQTGRVSEKVKISEVEGLFDGDKLESTFESLFNLEAKYWGKYKLNASDINKIIAHKNTNSTFNSGDSFHGEGDTFDVDGAWDESSWRLGGYFFHDRNFKTVEEFVEWLDHPNNNKK